MEPAERSFELIDADDLARFALIALRDRDDFFARYARAQHFLCSALCQGAAKHYVDRINGVKDIDVWSFFVKTEGVPDFNARRRVERDLGPSKFGVHPHDMKRGFTGRRVDLLGRSIDVTPGEGPVEALRRYLSERRTGSASHLQKKAVVLLEPRELAGTVVWPV
ncbi:MULTISPECIES: hypothetical protein [Ralstonia solanacearum species complex]|uniref:hypothetical protein n=1 Tax=Ralstonia solanacearum species complex TaxID=3116862 RepID=UPI001267A6C9|nr:hypothetical protein [Ralstonia pseudosolanacearum]MCK4125575.1 hypothetical protein [Ralstonia pseudosolanacearum]MDO3559729.1 hypothetical protein [Ralstonia pseudosolanacearum]MDO3579388.1 hypothetical protein [Ralstonia pseudosolanacearum]MDO3589300.1 hypothetical protein [Ralstonia pseudosolanacearum]